MMNVDTGDFCPHCGLMISMPTDIDPVCLGCGRDVTEEESKD
ncbi:hypothetical protein [Vibrio harveyi]|nr:hypothetical protein [Vibrio harveyi]